MGFHEFSGGREEGVRVQPEPGLQCLVVFVHACAGAGVRNGRGGGPGEEETLYPDGSVAISGPSGVKPPVRSL